MEMDREGERELRLKRRKGKELERRKEIGIEEKDGKKLVRRNEIWIEEKESRTGKNISEKEGKRD
jgi:hypothetical protein